MDIEPSRKQRRLWDDADTHSLAMGCVVCADRHVCGGLHKEQDAFSCLDNCCGKPTGCEAICPQNPSGFRASLREVDGFTLDNIPRAAPCAAGPLPQYAPAIYHRNRREAALSVDLAALPLRALFASDGTPRFETREQLRQAFLLSEHTSIMLLGSGRDKSIERWWGWSGSRRAAIDSLRSLDIALTTSPNFSLFTDALRYEDLFNIKRIAIAWHEFVDGQVPSALHVNARTVRDYERFAQFIRGREEVTEIAFEFGTGAGWLSRRDFHARHLAEVARFVGRPLRLVMVGGGALLPYLSAGFHAVTYVDTSPFMKAMHRRSQCLILGQLTDEPFHTPPNAPVDELLARNIARSRAHHTALMPEVRNEPRLKTPGSRASEKDAAA